MTYGPPPGNQPGQPGGGYGPQQGGQPGGYGPPPGGGYGQPGQYGPPPQPGQYGPPPQGGQYGPPPQGGQYGPPQQGGQYGPPPQGGQYGPPQQYGGSHGHRGGKPGFDFSRVSPYDWGILGAAVLAFIFSFINFYTYSGKGDLSGQSEDRSAWTGFFGWFAVLLALVGAAAVAVELFAPQVKLPVPSRLIALAAFALATISLILALFIVPDLNGGGTGYDEFIDEGHGFGYWVTLVAVVAALVLTLLRFRQTGGSLSALTGGTTGGRSGDSYGQSGYGAPQGYQQGGYGTPSQPGYQQSGGFQQQQYTPTPPPSAPQPPPGGYQPPSAPPQPGGYQPPAQPGGGYQPPSGPPGEQPPPGQAPHAPYQPPEQPRRDEGQPPQS